MWGGTTNQGLSQDRATSVLRYLSEHGVPAAQLKAVGFGEARPIASNATRVCAGYMGGLVLDCTLTLTLTLALTLTLTLNQPGRSRNRRVEFHLLPRESELHLRSVLSDLDALHRIASDDATVAMLRGVVCICQTIATRGFQCPNTDALYTPPLRDTHRLQA